MTGRRLTIEIVLAIVAALAAGCGQKAAAPQDPALATVNGEPITQALLDSYVRSRLHGDPGAMDAAARRRALEDLLKLKSAAARAAGQYAQELELLRIEYLAREAARRAEVWREPTEAEIEAAYREYLTSETRSEYRVAHILVATQEAARGVLLRLRGGEDFAAMASRESADDSKANGGDVGWRSARDLPAEMLPVLKSLAPGEVAQLAVKTRYGWHVLRLLGTRAAQPPALEQVRAQLIVNISQAKYRTFLEASLREAKVAFPEED